jgi:hypothetical protein
MEIKLGMVFVILLLLLIGPRQVWAMLAEWVTAFLELFEKIVDEVGVFMLNLIKRIFQRFS